MNSRKTSEIWNHYSQIDANKAKCGYCKQVISTKGGSNGNLSQHIRLKHGHIPIYRSDKAKVTSQFVFSATIFADNLPSTSQQTVVVAQEDYSKPSVNKTPEQSSISEFLVCTKPVPISKSKKIDHQLIRMIVKEYQPFKIVEDVEFQNFVKLLCPGYNLPSRKTISESLIPQLYESTLENVKSSINEAFSVCITTDGWTSIDNRSFVAVTAHWINKRSELKSNLLVSGF